jgi:hypothetical protein
MADPLSNSILLEPPLENLPHRRRYKIIFITGNPGLIEYYRTFLTHLYALLTTSVAGKKSDVSYSVSGSSLIGFEIPGGNGGGEDRKGAWTKLGLKKGPPFGLTEVIDAAEKNVLLTCKGSEEEDGVILVGHSVGAYIALEIIQRHRARLEKEGNREPRIVGGICLFPTVTHISQSPRGKLLTVSSLPSIDFVSRGYVCDHLIFLTAVLCTEANMILLFQKLSKLPSFQSIIPLFFSFFLSLIPIIILQPLIRQITKFQIHSTATTAAFLKSKHGVHQAW